ncbi:MAG: TIGR03560 family F420-dependent LLM class oxidoreductase [Candidatus Bathyarchaeota archaeon]|nr:TIGR03560 family F420-dependent LLM class oxidoreductase [Candidatus Bathyarchaeota archaeon]
MANNKFGVFLPFYAFRNKQKNTPLFNLLKEAVKQSEQLNYHSAWLDDHLMINQMPLLETWTSLAALSTVTKKIRLGTMVTCNSFRHPSLLAKMAVTVDQISGGRLELGIGAGVQQSEHTAYGFDFPSPKKRVERLNEAIEIMKLLWTQKTADYNGEYYTLKDAFCEPKPTQKPYPPIIVGGGGEKYTLKVTAKHADRFDWGYLSSVDEYQRKLKVLETHCDAVGRSFEEIEKSCWPMGQIFLAENKKELDKLVPKWLPEGVSRKDFVKSNFVGTPEECVKHVQKYVDVGVNHFMLFFGDLPSLRGLKIFAESVVPAI